MRLTSKIDKQEEQRLEKNNHFLEYMDEHPGRVIARTLFEHCYVFRNAMNIPKTKDEYFRDEMIKIVSGLEIARLIAYGYFAYQLYEIFK